MSEEVPVERRDIGILVALSIAGGVLIASWISTPSISPQFFQAIFVGACLLAFFLFIPVMGVRLFVDDQSGE
ncbi:hypothetical protein [Natrarchaeobaculum aegyptiacum]|uniref:Uncharacterized protein n=1 Tax=Natrarchaeobaculum aegyptiacum TaxID=745377 RepID=A0A2Z2HYV6_9EURY|nr:hypothetical protein [Natrarchaeobaculum aegyptiacum]ARS90334.1 hypothetical protein B1756_11770 [Natrarchaeobaculum aegyptiacum]